MPPIITVIEDQLYEDVGNGEDIQRPPDNIKRGLTLFTLPQSKSGMHNIRPAEALNLARQFLVTMNIISLTQY